MIRTYLSAKLHRIHVTAASVDYVGSVSIDADLMELVGIDAFEQVHVVNLATGHRWITYAVPGPHGEFSLNGGGARLGAVGDLCVVMAYVQAEHYTPARVALIGAHNREWETTEYLP